MMIQNKSDFAELEHISLEQFFPLICSNEHRHAVIWQNRPNYEIIWRVFHCANTIREDWDCDFAEMGKSDDFFIQCQDMYDNWDWDLVDPLVVEIAPPNILRLVNGHHRSFTLGCLLLTEKEQFRPLPALNTAKLRFDPASDVSIFLAASAAEFLKFAKLSPEKAPIGEMPRKMRLNARKLYERKLTEASRVWRDLTRQDATGAHIHAKLHVRDNNLQFDEIVIDAETEQVAIGAAFIADAAIHKIQAGDILIPLFSPCIKVKPPYIYEKSKGGAV